MDMDVYVCMYVCISSMYMFLIYISTYISQSLHSAAATCSMPRYVLQYFTALHISSAQCFGLSNIKQCVMCHVTLQDH